MAGRTGSDFVTQAGRYVGTPYVWGGESPRGFDCSGLVDYVLSSMGLRNVPRTSEAQWAWAQPIDHAGVQPGDLVFLNFPGEQSPGHVMIYAGGNTVIQAPAPGQDVQRSKFKPIPAGGSEWGATVVGYGRVPGLSYSGEPATPVKRGGVPGGSSVSSTRPRPGGGGGGVTGALDSALGFAGTALDDVLGLISSPLDFLKMMVWLVNPLTWLRGVEVLFGGTLLALALLIAVKADKELEQVAGSAAAGMARE